jgi:hypothetical protein
MLLGDEWTSHQASWKAPEVAFSTYLKIFITTIHPIQNGKKSNDFYRFSFGPLSAAIF